MRRDQVEHFADILAHQTQIATAIRAAGAVIKLAALAWRGVGHAGAATGFAFSRIFTGGCGRIILRRGGDAFSRCDQQVFQRQFELFDLAKAFRYALNRWSSFTLFLEDGRIAIDNNAAERAMRPIGVGRKNWLFAGSDTGGETLARAITLNERRWWTGAISMSDFSTRKPRSISANARYDIQMKKAKRGYE